jgi:hypothetical protein
MATPPVLPSAEAVGRLPLYGGGGIRPEISACWFTDPGELA